MRTSLYSFMAVSTFTMSLIVMGCGQSDNETPRQKVKTRPKTAQTKEQAETQAKLKECQAPARRNTEACKKLREAQQQMQRPEGEAEGQVQTAGEQRRLLTASEVQNFIRPRLSLAPSASLSQLSVGKYQLVEIVNLVRFERAAAKGQAATDAAQYLQRYEVVVNAATKQIEFKDQYVGSTVKLQDSATYEMRYNLPVMVQVETGKITTSLSKEIFSKISKTGITLESFATETSRASVFESLMSLQNKEGNNGTYEISNNNGSKRTLSLRQKDNYLVISDDQDDLAKNKRYRSLILIFSKIEETQAEQQQAAESAAPETPAASGAAAAPRHAATPGAPATGGGAAAPQAPVVAPQAPAADTTAEAPATDTTTVSETGPRT